MMIFRGAALRVTFAVVAIVLFTYAGLLLTVNSATFQDWLRLELAKQTGYDIAGELRLNPLLRIDANALSVSKAGKAIFRAEHGRMIITPLGLFSRKVHRLSLKQPTLYLELNELMKKRKESAPDFSFRHLEIENGALALELGGGKSLEFKSLAVSAENINLDETGGLNLRAEIPWIQGAAELVLTGDENETSARLAVKQAERQAPEKFLKSKPRLRDAFEAEIKFIKKPDESLELTATAKLNDMVIGHAGFSGSADLRAALDADRDHADITATIVATDLPTQIKGIPITLPKAASALAFEASFLIADKEMVVRSFRLHSPLGEAGGAAQIAFTPEFAISDSTVMLRKMPLEYLKQLLPIPMNALSANGLLDAELKLRGAWRSLTILGTVQGSGISLSGQDFALREISFKTPVEWSRSGFFANGVHMTGKKLLVRQESRMPLAAEDLRITGRVEQRTNAAARAAGQLRIGRARFASLDGTRIGENITITGAFSVAHRPDFEAISFNGRLDFEQGEILWDKFFADLKSQRPALQFDADYALRVDHVRLRELSLAVASAGRIVAQGAVEHASKNPLMLLEIKSEGLQPGGIFESFVRPTLNRSFPALDQLLVRGGLSFTVKAGGTLEDLIIEGTMQLRGGELQNKVKNWQLGPMQLNLPLRIRYPGTSSAPTAQNAPSGTLTIARAEFGSEILPSITTKISFWNNELRFGEMIRLPVYGGMLEVSRLSFRNLIAEPQAVSLSLEAKNLRLERLSDALGWYRFGGTLSGSIPKMEWDSGSLRSEGRIQVEVFGGRVQISTLEIDSPFSPVPSLKLDARFSDISLDQASKTFAFGQISGILQGRVNDLVITAGQPSEFRAEVQSVEKRGVSQRISVESLNKITVLSSGNDAGALYGGIASFFETFRYSKLGFKATLKNDKLTLRGVESREDGEYLVVGSFIPPTVNVISHTQVIAFSELLRRLEQVQTSENRENAAN